MKLKALSLATVAISLFVVPALAHHSFAMFDHNQMVTLPGTVAEFEWINPHAWLHLSVINEAGETAAWSFEMGSVAQLTRDGWKRDTISVGNEVQIGFHPLKDGSYGGQLRHVIFPDGKILCQGNHCAALPAGE